MYTHTYIYIYIYRERESEREIDYRCESSAYADTLFSGGPVYLVSVCIYQIQCELMKHNHWGLGLAVRPLT